jgi:hypothetical protein
MASITGHDRKLLARTCPLNFGNYSIHFRRFTMRTKGLVVSMAAALGIGLLSLAPGALAANDSTAKTMDCQMTFTLNGWSAIYKTASGSGTVTCDNGQSMPVTLSAKGGGLSFGKYKIDDGHGNFTDVTNIRQVLGSYARATAHAGAVKSAHASAMTKGDISLALSGQGSGWDIGVGFSGFTIKTAN